VPGSEDPESVLARRAVLTHYLLGWVREGIVASPVEASQQLTEEAAQQVLQLFDLYAQANRIEIFDKGLATAYLEDPGTPQEKPAARLSSPDLHPGFRLGGHGGRAGDSARTSAIGAGDDH
jgi:hypothetical protein